MLKCNYNLIDYVVTDIRLLYIARSSTRNGGAFCIFIKIFSKGWFWGKANYKKNSKKQVRYLCERLGKEFLLYNRCMDFLSNPSGKYPTLELLLTALKGSAFVSKLMWWR